MQSVSKPLRHRKSIGRKCDCKAIASADGGGEAVEKGYAICAHMEAVIGEIGYCAMRRLICSGGSRSTGNGAQSVTEPVKLGV